MRFSRRDCNVARFRRSTSMCGPDSVKEFDRELRFPDDTSGGTSSSIPPSSSPVLITVTTVRLVGFQFLTSLHTSYPSIIKAGGTVTLQTGIGRGRGDVATRTTRVPIKSTDPSVAPTLFETSSGRGARGLLSSKIRVVWCVGIWSLIGPTWSTSTSIRCGIKLRGE